MADASADAIAALPAELPVLACRFCGENNPQELYVCNACGESMLVSYLESQGTGVIPNGHVWPLCRRNYRLGRQMHNHYIIPSHSASSVLLEYYGMDTFCLHPPEQSGVCQVNDEPIEERVTLNPGDVVRIGTDTFAYFEGQPPDGTARIDRQGAQEAQFVLNGAYIEIAGTRDLNRACAVAVDAVLKITRMDRGVFFITETDDAGELILQQCVTRQTSAAYGFTDVDSPFRISQSLLRQSLEEGGTIILEDARKRPQVSQSMIELNLKSIACIPIVYSERSSHTIEDCIGIIYADSFLPTYDVADHAVPILTMLASFLSSVIMNWHQ
jgi:hypothetical protein